MYRPEITGEQAVQAVRDWWQTGESSKGPGAGWKHLTQAMQDLSNRRLMAGNLENRCNVAETLLTYVPFWKFEAYATGRIKGYNSEPGVEVEILVPVDEIIYEHRTFIRIACDREAVGFERLPAETGEILSPEENRATAPETTVRGKDVLARGLEDLRTIAIRNSKVEHVRSKKVDVKAVDLKLVFYPVWIVKYTFSDDTYTATINGINGNILSGQAPGDWLIRSIVLAEGVVSSIISAIASIAITHLCYLIIATQQADNTGQIIFVAILFILPIALVAPVCWFITYPAFALFTRGGSIAAGESSHGYNPGARNEGGQVIATIIGVTIGYAIVFLGWILFYYHGIWQASALIFALMVLYMLACMVVYQPYSEYGKGISEYDEQASDNEY